MGYICSLFYLPAIDDISLKVFVNRLQVGQRAPGQAN